MAISCYAISTKIRSRLANGSFTKLTLSLRWTKHFKCTSARNKQWKILIKLLRRGGQQNAIRSGRRVQPEASRCLFLETKKEEVILRCDLDIQSEVRHYHPIRIARDFNLFWLTSGNKQYNTAQSHNNVLFLLLWALTSIYLTVVLIKIIIIIWY